MKINKDCLGKFQVQLEAVVACVIIYHEDHVFFAKAALIMKLLLLLPYRNSFFDLPLVVLSLTVMESLLKP
ncbi:hypothetical protein Bca4012_048529 [Brassica carinata]